MKKEQIVDVINEIKAKSWNECITPRIVSINSFLSSDEWQKGILPWLLSQKERMNHKLMFGCPTRDDDQMVRGHLAALIDIIDLHNQVKKVLDQKAPARPSGTAGY